MPLQIATPEGQRDMTPEEEAEFTANLPQPPVPDPKLVGVEILGVMCSATNQDQSGMTAIGLAALLARSSGGILPPTEMKFENGNSLVITDANFNQVQAIWLPFRQSFFAVAD